MAKTSINFSQLSILVADGNPHIRQLISGMLHEFGAKNVTLVDDGEAAVKALKERTLDVVLVDTLLPKIDGFELTKKIRRDLEDHKRTLPVLLMLSDATPEAVVQARDAGANMVLAKPLSPSAIYDHLSWLATAERSFITAEDYYGPDRRFQSRAAPADGDRRGKNLSGDAGQPKKTLPTQQEINQVLDQTSPEIPKQAAKS